MLERTLQVVSVTATENNLDLTVGNRREIRTSCAAEEDLPDAAHGVTAGSQAAAPVGEGAVIHP
jgi:hypothetical protein